MMKDAGAKIKTLISWTSFFFEGSILVLKHCTYLASAYLPSLPALTTFDELKGLFSHQELRGAKGTRCV